MASAAPPVLFVLGDLGDPRCGVGSSTAALLEASPEPIGTITVAARLGAIASAARAARAVVVVYPTRSTLQRWRALLAAIAARFGARDRPRRLYLHEFRFFHPVHRAVVAVALRFASDRIVVSTEVEAGAVRRALRAVRAGGREVVVAPPVNGTAPSELDVKAAIEGAPPDAVARRARTVGVFGMLRPDKGEAWLLAQLRGLDGRFDRLEICGDGWEQLALPPDLAGRYELVRLGHVPDGELAPMFAGWGVAIAPFWSGAHDGRMSLRTPLAYGVPTISRAAGPDELTLRPPHLLLLDDGEAPTVPVFDDRDRRAGADAVAAFEARAAEQVLAALLR